MYCHDYEKINSLLKSVGFNKINRTEFNPLEDSKQREKYLRYIIVEKWKTVHCKYKKE